MAVMMIAFAIVVAVVNHSNGGLFAVSVINALLAFWGNGVAANFSHDDAQSVPTYAALLGMITLLGSVVLLILHFVV